MGVVVDYSVKSSVTSDCPGAFSTVSGSGVGGRVSSVSLSNVDSNVEVGGVEVGEGADSQEVDGLEEPQRGHDYTFNPQFPDQPVLLVVRGFTKLSTVLPTIDTISFSLTTPPPPSSPLDGRGITDPRDSDHGRALRADRRRTVPVLGGEGNHPGHFDEEVGVTGEVGSSGSNERQCNSTPTDHHRRGSYLCLVTSGSGVDDTLQPPPPGGSSCPEVVYDPLHTYSVGVGGTSLFGYPDWVRDPDSGINNV